MSRIDFTTFIEDPTYVIGNSSAIHEQIKQALIAEADQNNAFRNFVLQQSTAQQTIVGNLFVDGEFATSSAFSTAGFDVNADGIVDFNAEVHFQPETILQEFVKDGYVDLANDQTVNGIKYFANIKKTSAPVDTDDLTNKSYVDNQVTILHDNIQANLDIIDTDLLELHNTKQPNIVTTDDFEIHTLTLNGDLIIDNAKINKSKIIDLNDDLSTIYSGLTSLQNSKQNNITAISNIEMNDITLNGDLIIADAKINKSKVIDLNSDLSTISTDITNLQNDKQPNLTNNSINDNWLSNNIPRYDIVNVFQEEVVCDALTVVNAVNISDGALNKSKILDLNTDLSAITNDITDLQNDKQDNLTNNSINDGWLSSNVVLNNSNQTFQNDVTITGVLYATNMEVTNLTTINQTSTEETITNLTVDDLTVNNNLVMGATSSLTLLDASIAISKINNLSTVLNSKASNQSVTDGLALKQNTVQDGDLSISHISGLSTQLNDRVTYDVYTLGLGGKQNVISDADLAISHVYNLQTILDTKATTTELTNGLNTKQDTIGAGDLLVSYVSGLQTELDTKATSTELTNGLNTKQDTIGSNDLQISYVSGLQSELDTKATTTELTNGLNTKQDTIGTGDLLVSYVTGLQTELDTKAVASDVATSLSQKQDTVGANDLSISFVSGLQTELDSKATTTELTNGLNAKQDTIGANDLSISFVSGLQTELDGKATSTELTNGLNTKQNTITSGSITDGLLASTFLKPDTNLTISSGRTLTLSGSIISNGATISPEELSYLDNLTEPLPTTLASLQTQIDGISTNIDLSGYQTLISNSNQIAISNVDGLSTALSGKQSTLSNASYLDFTSSGQGQIDTINTTISGLSAPDLSGYQTILTNGSVSDSMLASTFVKPSTDFTSGSITLGSGKTISGVSATTMGFLDATSSIQTQLNSKQATLTNGSVSDALLASTFVKPSTAPTLTGSNFSGIPTSAIIGYSSGGGLTSESISGTTAIDPEASVSIVTGSTHSLALSSTVGLTKTIVNNNANCFTSILTAQAGAVNPSISAMVYDATTNRMYLSGTFTTLNGVASATHVCYYDFASSSIVAMGTGVTGGSQAVDIKVDGTRVYITGAFTQVGGVANTARIAFWNSSNNSWNAMGSGLSDGFGIKMLIHSGNLYLAGSFTTVVGVSNTANIARWNISGSTWNAMGLGITTGSVSNFQVIGTKIWFCGTFTAVNGTSPVANSSRLAYWETTNSSWNGYGTSVNQYNNNITTIRDMGNNKLFVAGNYTTYGSAPAVYAPYTTLYDTATNAITQYGIGGPSPAWSFVDSDGILWIVGGGFTTLGTNLVGDTNAYYTTSAGIAWFNTATNQWVPILTNVSNSVTSFSNTGTAGEYWIGGQFSTIDNNAVFGLSSLVRFNKNNVTTVTTTNLVNNGLTNRTSFKMYYKGQSIMLINPDNSTWMISNNTYLGANAPSVLLY